MAKVLTTKGFIEKEKSADLLIVKNADGSEKEINKLLHDLELN